MYRYETVIRLRHTDAAGLIYFASVFTLAHECYEAFLDGHISLGRMLAEGEYMAPIVHAEADMARPMRLSEKMVIEMELVKRGNSSYELGYAFRNDGGEVAAKVRVVHSMLKRETHKPVRIPERFRKVLESL